MSSEGLQHRILHVDMDAFYASVEQHDRPELKGQPVIVGGPIQRGVVASASYEARKFGVKSAIPTAQALRLCPQAILIRSRFERYGEVSRQIREIFLNYTPLVEPLSLDEAFLDVTGVEKLFGPAEQIAQEIKRKILDSTGLTCSVGVSFNKFLAKLASDLCKPSGLLVMDEPRAEEILPGLPVGRLWGVGPTTEEKMHQMRLRTIGDVQRASREELIHSFGKYGVRLHELAWGIDERPVEPEQKAQSMSRETTFPEDLSERTMLKKILFELSEQVASDLREAELIGRTIHLKVRFADFTTITRSQTLPLPLKTAQALWQAAEKLFDVKVEIVQGIRLLGVGVSNLQPAGAGQLTLFNEGETREVKVDRVLDQLRGRFGRDAIRRGAS
jgi:DNA polymerase-4